MRALMPPHEHPRHGAQARLQPVPIGVAVEFLRHQHDLVPVVTVTDAAEPSNITLGLGTGHVGHDARVIDGVRAVTDVAALFPLVKTGIRIMGDRVTGFGFGVIRPIVARPQ